VGQDWVAISAPTYDASAWSTTVERVVGVSDEMSNRKNKGGATVGEIKGE